jgi:hypothetical protein
LENIFIDPIVGLTCNIGHGSWCIKYAMTFSMNDDLPVCAENMTATDSTPGLPIMSIGSRRYSTTDVRHRPGDADDSGDKRRYLSAHWLTVRSGGGTSASRASMMRSDALQYFTDCVLVDIALAETALFGE